MDDLITIELYILDRISHFSYEALNLSLRPKLSQIDQLFLNEYKSYIHTYRDVLFFIRKLREKKNDDTNRGEDHPEEA